MAEANSEKNPQSENTDNAKDRHDKLDTLEDLLTTLSRQINNSDWLQQNTPEKFAAENPEVAQVFQDLSAKNHVQKENADQR